MTSQAQQSRVNNLVAKIGSFNDEIRDTNKEVERVHAQRDALLAEVESLRIEKEYLFKILPRQRKKIIADTTDILNKSRKRTALSEEIAGLFQDKTNSLDSLIGVLSSLEAGHRRKVTKAKEQRERAESKLLITTERLKEKEKELEGKIETVNKLTEGIRVGNQELTETTTKRTENLQDIANERAKFKQRVQKKEREIEEKENSFMKRQEDFGRQERDIKVVLRRLKEEWKKAKIARPFPLIKWPIQHRG